MHRDERAVLSEDDKLKQIKPAVLHYVTRCARRIRLARQAPWRAGRVYNISARDDRRIGYARPSSLPRRVPAQLMKYNWRRDWFSNLSLMRMIREDR